MEIYNNNKKYIERITSQALQSTKIILLQIKHKPKNVNTLPYIVILSSSLKKIHPIYNRNLNAKIPLSWL
jgi:hypothetical protein